MHLLLGILRLALCSVAMCRLPLDKIESINSTEIETGAGSVYINTHGPLNLIRGYIYHRKGLVYNKRFVSPEIDVSYSLKEGENKAGVFVRTPSKDTVSLRVCSTRAQPKYCARYYRTLIQMFPSVDGSVSIVWGRRDSFYRFLTSNKNKEHSMHVLASLFLLSEGVDVPMETTPSEVIFKGAGKPVSLTSDIFVWSEKEQEAQLVKQRDALAVIKFFKESGHRSSSARTGSLPGASICSADISGAEAEARSYTKTSLSCEYGDVLETAQFLIQAYIFEYLESPESGIELCKCVHKILQNMMEECSHENAALESVFDRIFTRQDAPSHKYTASLARALSILEQNVKFPFANISQVPTYTSIPPYDTALKEFTEDSSKNYSNCVETGLYTLLCCILYSPDSRKYKVQNIASASGALKEFFSEHKKPEEYLNNRVHREWGKVVQSLPDAHIVYNRGTHELRSGLLNLLLALAHITDCGSD
ncbi:uncharacterized protein NEMAJ01_1672, partial [Nematocida major]|uniref:uncharacterized protein n=1 Tax=Nematocida major TaxID=1912982 RepID=UPI002007EC67